MKTKSQVVAYLLSQHPVYQAGQMAELVKDAQILADYLNNEPADQNNLEKSIIRLVHDSARLRCELKKLLTRP